jgi:enolase
MPQECPFAPSGRSRHPITRLRPEYSALADVALGCEMLKTGAPARSERTAKFNQLLRIQEQVDDAADYAAI